jgi:hypothetical protein
VTCLTCGRARAAPQASAAAAAPAVASQASGASGDIVRPLLCQPGQCHLRHAGRQIQHACLGWEGQRRFQEG